MEKSLSVGKSSSSNYHSDEDEAEFRCGECGEEFVRPLLAQVSSQGDVRTYYACPRCLTQVKEVRSQKSERDENAGSLEEPKRLEAKPEENVSCQHFLGYLKRRPKDTPVPEDCLMCEKMIECMAC